MNIQANGSDQGDMIAELARLREENAKLKVAANSKLHLKVSQAGAVSLYGMGKWPVTLYRGQWERVLDKAQDIRDFIEAHASELSTK